ncbi:hypothetical protein CH063_14477 [Colletotrichum higginsianum]|uniref:RNA helicase-like protein n=3 Tax=Colletotrichum higginsianum TaxID=80884 RepID=H1VYQ7_COLHI|nr:RNA helicase-like protein [Colletotrichum higginsianum IMI 349063]OBR02828.1 RNA helicase-like protein [Colletotrichum higginsianum IMI 349063]TID06540.1 hypothetical protein CH35J_000520 [Colletotrichum higginsianum]CCF45369.1 hypothetical protein CH063_14477 [Colletotrichum higginsianum]
MPADEHSGERRDQEGRHRRTRSQSVTRSRSRSRSPRRHRDETRRRSPIDGRSSRRERRRSPRREDRDRESSHHHRHHHHRHRGYKDKDQSSKKPATAATEPLPYEARQLSKSELGVFRPLLAYYLDLQKQKDIRDMDEREVRGRWKSFVGKWNRGQLSQGWYDPEMFVAAKERAIEEGIDGPRDGAGRDETEEAMEEKRGRVGDEDGIEDDEDDDEDDDDLGPRPPPTAREGGQRSGPGIPSMADLSLHRETLAEEAQREREARVADLRQQRKDDRKLQRERLDDVAPRAEAGTRERQLEKKALVNDKMKEFRDKGGGDGGVPEVAEQELMGGGDSLQEFKAMKAREERKKTEREVRREEIARAREVERQERVREYREREEGVMKGLRELARQRFG